MKCCICEIEIGNLVFCKRCIDDVFLQKCAVCLNFNFCKDVCKICNKIICVNCLCDNKTEVYGPRNYKNNNLTFLCVDCNF